MNKNKLKVGDLIRFHDWGTGSRLFGIIIEHEDAIYCSKLNIWRPRDIYFLQAHGIDNVSVINSVHDVEDYELQDFFSVLKAAKENNIFCRFVI